MKIVDTHAHIDQLEDLDRSLNDAKQAGVEVIVAVSMDLESSKKNLEIKKNFSEPMIYLAMGIHPSEANSADLQSCADLIRHNKDELSAVEEIGLDFWYKWVRKDKEKKDQQREVYRFFLELAKECGLPAIIHSRGTWRECFEMAKEIDLKKAVFHWYSGPLDVLDEIMSAGYYVSTTPSVAYSPQSQEAMMHADINQTLIETDCPVYYKNRDVDEQGFQAEPKDVFKTLSAYCKLKNMEEKKALKIFNQNAVEFFSMADLVF